MLSRDAVVSDLPISIPIAREEELVEQAGLAPSSNKKKLAKTISGAALGIVGLFLSTTNYECTDSDTGVRLLGSVMVFASGAIFDSLANESHIHKALKKLGFFRSAQANPEPHNQPAEPNSQSAEANSQPIEASAPSHELEEGSGHPSQPGLN